MSCIERGWLVGCMAAADLRVRCGLGACRLRGAVSGQSTVEYALVGALVVIAAAGVLTLLGGEIATVFSRITNTLSGAAASAR